MRRRDMKRNTLKISNPNVVLTRSMKQCIENLNNANVSYDLITKGYMIFAGHFFESELPVNIGLHYRGDKLIFIEIFRDIEYMEEASSMYQIFDEFHKELLETCGEPTTFSYSDSINKHETWFLEGVTITHFIHERHVVEDRLSISLLPTEEEVKTDSSKILKIVTFIAGLVLGLVFFIIYGIIEDDVSLSTILICFGGGLLFGLFMYIGFSKTNLQNPSPKKHVNMLVEYEKNYVSNYNYEFVGSMNIILMNNMFVLSQANCYIFDDFLELIVIVKGEVESYKVLFADILKVSTANKNVYITLINGNFHEIKFKGTHEDIIVMEKLNEYIERYKEIK